MPEPDAPHPTPVDPAEVREVLAKPGRFTAEDGTEVDVIYVHGRYELFITRRHGTQAGIRVTPELAAWLAEHVRPIASLSAPVPPEPQLSAEVEELEDIILPDLRDSLAWLDRWPIHVGGCQPWTEEGCKCGRSLARDRIGAVVALLQHRLAPPSSIDTSTEGGES